MSAFEQIGFEVSGLVAVVTLNRPDKLNAWTPLMEREVAAAVGEAVVMPDVRAILLTGAGRGFCAGADLTGTHDPDAPRPGPERFRWLWDAPKVVVAAINGPAAGVGLSIALHCDIRFLADDASVTTAFARRGLIAEHASAWLLPRIVGPQAAADLLFSGRKIEAAEAERLGLGRRLSGDDFLAQAQAQTAELVAHSSPRSLRVIKAQQRAGFAQTYAEASAMAHEEQALSVQSADFREGVAAFRERRPAIFTSA
jgi:enoyl-CoA hydratase/carnithine racemase